MPGVLRVPVRLVEWVKLAVAVVGAAEDENERENDNEREREAGRGPKPPERRRPLAEERQLPRRFRPMPCVERNVDVDDARLEERR